MTARLIDGKHIAADYTAQIKSRTSKHLQNGGRAPGLAVILLGDDPASHIYVNKKVQACHEVGFLSRAEYLDADTSEAKLLTLIDQLNADDTIDGILVQLPLPEHISTIKVLERVRADKDVDGFHPYNAGRLAQGAPLLRPCTPLGIIHLLNTIEEPFHERQAVIVGASNIVGRPVAMELLLKGATITICHQFTRDLATHVRQADILVAGVGKPSLIPGDWIKPGATIIDVGMNRLASGKLVGDVDFQTASQYADWITPVPGGVGPMTVAMLLGNTLKAAEMRETGSMPTP